jgi:hypothetical protein
MKQLPVHLFRILTCAWVPAFAFAPVPAAGQASAELPYPVTFELGDADFAPGDSISIQSIQGSQPTIAVGQTYRVTGTYTLSSVPAATLALFTTSRSTNSSPIDPQQTVRIQKGSGTFSLQKVMNEEGYLHLSFYPASGGSDLGGVYFGEGEWVLRNKGGTHRRSSSGGADQKSASAGSPEAPATLAAQNRVILQYLGEPAAPPATLDPAYTREGLDAAMRLAALKAGISLKRLEIDDSEFPCLIGIIFAQDDYAKLVEQIKKMPAYEEQGGVSSVKCHCFNITPWRVFPSEASQRISRRLTLREEMFYDRLSTQ